MSAHRWRDDRCRLCGLIRRGPAEAREYVTPAGVVYGPADRYIPLCSTRDAQPTRYLCLDCSWEGVPAIGRGAPRPGSTYPSTRLYCRRCASTLLEQSLHPEGATA